MQRVRDDGDDDLDLDVDIEVDVHNVVRDGGNVNVPGENEPIEDILCADCGGVTRCCEASEDVPELCADCCGDTCCQGSENVPPEQDDHTEGSLCGVCCEDIGSCSCSDCSL